MVSQEKRSERMTSSSSAYMGSRGDLGPVNIPLVDLEEAELGLTTWNDKPCPDSAYNSRNPSPAPTCSRRASSSTSIDEKSRNRLSRPPLVQVEEETNVGEVVTRAQQWKIMAATALQGFWVLGLNQSFGIWQKHYGSEAAVADGILRAGDMRQRAAIAAIGSLSNGGIVAAFAMLYYPNLPRIGKHIKTLCYIGTLLISIGFAAAAGSTHLWTLLLTQGLMVGMGSGVFLYTLSPILPEYFGSHSGLAQGVATAAGAIGGTILSLTLPRLLETVGTRWTLGSLSITSAVICSLVSLLAQPPRRYEKRNTHVVGWRTFMNPTFMLLFITNLIHPLTLAIPMTFGPEFSTSLGISNQMGAVLLAIISAVGIPSRLLCGYAADIIGHHNILLVATAVYTLGTWSLWLIAARTDNCALWIAFNVAYGLVNGTFNSVINSLQRKLFGDESYYPYNGAMTSIRGIGYVVGVPLAGSLVSRVVYIQLRGTDFEKPIIYTGGMLTVSMLCLVGARTIEVRKMGWKLIQ